HIKFIPFKGELSNTSKRVKLAYAESMTLHLLAKNHSEVVSKEAISSFAWEGRIVTDSSLAKSISNIRKGLRELGVTDEVIVTIPKVGYRLVCELQPTTAFLNELGTSTISHGETISINSHNKSICKPPKIDVKLSENISFIKSLSERAFIPLNAILIMISIYNFSFVISNDLDKVYLSKEYEKSTIKIDNKSMSVITRKGSVVTDELKKIISLPYPGSMVFVQNNAGYYNISFTVGQNKSVSFTFREENYAKGLCKIKSVISEGGHVCAI
ncbi:winged helix-turn-helix domain-containing protein, partial [Aeromonas sp. HMWF015]|uniref:winged helix-turn-helix domain-containing protein n=1 Tax=Aeromonas sp. HMWF015 TaxID=2056851 RepID=UPI000D412673